MAPRRTSEAYKKTARTTHTREKNNSTIERVAMCEFCSKSEVTIEKLDPDKDAYPCEWISEEFGRGACAEEAVYSVSEWYVEDHLCDAHRLATEREMEEGLGEF
jgi:hypothetical protein